MKILPPRRAAQSFVIDGRVTVTVMTIEDGKVICGVTGARSACTEETHLEQLRRSTPHNDGRTPPTPPLSE